MMINEEPGSGPTSGLASRFGQRGVRHLRMRDRTDLEKFLESGQVAALPAFANLASLVRDAQAMSPDRMLALRDRMARLQHQWDSLGPDDRVQIANWVEMICLPWIEARVPLRGNGLEPGWAADLLLALFADFDSSGQVIETIDTGWTRPARLAGNVTTTTRLAVAAAWSSWSHLIVDPVLAGSALTLLGDLLDRLDLLSRQVSGDGFSPADRAWTRAALVLERRLLRHWHHGTSTVH